MSLLTQVILALVSGAIAFGMVALIQSRFQSYLMDIPNERSSHTQPTPRGGGLGFIVAFALTSSIAAILGGTVLDTAILWLILTPLAVIGIIDDRQGVPAKWRYLVQLLVSIGAIAYFSPFPWIEFGWMGAFAKCGLPIAFTLTVIGMTALINFYNFMDGLDGLVAGVTAVQLGFLAFYVQLPILWLLVAALVGFLGWNWSPAKIFMGDAGSTVLGATVAIALLQSQTLIQAGTALMVTAPLMGDALYTLLSRLLRRENIFQAHRTHLYQRLQQSGWSHAQVASIYIGATLLVAGVISSFDSLGAGLSLVGVVMAIALGEIYLKRSPRSIS